jgi:hypothetical protein
MPQHAIEECPQAPVINDMKTLLARVAVALEDIAAQGVMVKSHEKRLDKHDDNVEDLYSLIRELMGEIEAINVKHAREAGAAKVIEAQAGFWRKVKISLAPYMVGVVVGTAMFSFYLMDRFNVAQHLAKWWKEFKA